MFCNCLADKGENTVTSCSPYSTTRRRNVQRDTRSILAISVQQRPNERSLSSTSSGISSLGRPLSPFLSTVGPTSEYRARSVHFERWLPIHCLCNWWKFLTISSITILSLREMVIWLGAPVEDTPALFGLLPDNQDHLFPITFNIHQGNQLQQQRSAPNSMVPIAHLIATCPPIWSKGTWALGMRF